MEKDSFIGQSYSAQSSSQIQIAVAQISRNFTLNDSDGFSLYNVVHDHSWIHFMEFIHKGLLQFDKMFPVCFFLVVHINTSTHE